MSAGVVIAFSTKAELLEALRQLHASDCGEIRTYTPVSINEDEPRSVLPPIMLIAGLAGFAAGFVMEAYANTSAYPLDIGGRPELSWPALIPIAFEIGVLSAVLAGFVGYFVVCRLPHLYDPVDECGSMRRAARDLWIAAIRGDPGGLHRAGEIAQSLHACAIEELPP